MPGKAGDVPNHQFAVTACILSTANYESSTSTGLREGEGDSYSTMSQKFRTLHKGQAHILQQSSSENKASLSLL